MKFPAINKIARTDYPLIIMVMILAFYIAFIPHDNYPYLVHIDEWVHMVYSKAIIQAGDTNFVDPFAGGEYVLSLTSGAEVGWRLETGFHLFWAVFHQVSGISWLTIFKYFPAIVFLITILSVYILARREGFGWEAAFFAALIPTTVGILGPGFLIPLVLGLPFIPLSLFLLLNFRSVWSYLILFIFVCFLLLIHAVAAVLLVLIVAPFIILNLKGNFKHALFASLALVLPFLVPFPWIFNLLLPTAKSLFSPQPPLGYVEIPRVIATYGYLPLAFCILGVFALALRGGKRRYAFILGFLALILMLVVYFTFHYGVHIVYYRGLMYMMLMMGIIAGAGLMEIKNLKLPPGISKWMGSPVVTENVGRFLCMVVVVVTILITIPAHQDIPYYRMIDEQDYDAFTWIKENVDSHYDMALLDPWKATAFVAIAEKHVYTRIHSFPKDTDQEVYKFLESGCENTEFLRKKGISIVYTRAECKNPDLVKVRDNVYLLPEGNVP